MSIEFTITGRMWVGEELVIETHVEDDPASIYRFAADTWTELAAGRPWVIELSAVPNAWAMDPPEPERWRQGDAPMVGRHGHIPDVIAHFTEFRTRAMLAERLPDD